MISQVNWKILKKEQAELDNKIMQAAGFDLKWWNSLENKKRLKLALLVEIGEFANEMKNLFTIWKESKAINWEKAREELIDCLGYFLGLANLYQIESFLIKRTIKESFFNKNIVNQILLSFFRVTQNLFIGNAPITSAKKLVYQNWLKKFFKLSHQLKISEQEIMEIYRKKVNINYERLEKGRY